MNKKCLRGREPFPIRVLSRKEMRAATGGQGNMMAPSMGVGGLSPGQRAERKKNEREEANRIQDAHIFEVWVRANLWRL
jgi:hypothetical protein